MRIWDKPRFFSTSRNNLIGNKGKAKIYQVKQVLAAIERLEVENATKK